MDKVRSKIDQEVSVRVPTLILKKAKISPGDTVIIESNGENIIIRKALPHEEEDNIV